MTTTDGRSRLVRRGEQQGVIIPTQALILRFRVELLEIEPLVWREIEVPGDYSFWDLHVRIQDAMGWADYHLHRFTVPHPRTHKDLVFGSHNLGQDCDDPPGRATQVASVMTANNDTATYEYDFGDGWRHKLVLLDAVKRDFAPKYPRCTAGARACPPEDCGGVTGYADIVEGLTNGTLDEDSRTWLPEGYDPDRFDPSTVRFSDSHRRLAYSWYGDRDKGDNPFG